MDKLAVVVKNDHDQQLISRLLVTRNYRLFDHCTSLCASDEKFESIIICHRRSKQAPAPCLPNAGYTSRIIVLSDRAEEKTIVDALASGAHHYIDLRATERVLEARIDAALRSHPQHESLTLHVAPFTFKVDNRTAYYGEQKIDLTPREFELAHYLFSNRSRFVSESELMISVWTLPPSLDTRRIDTLISRIKRKMNLNTAQSKWKLVRMRNQGYQVRC